MAWLLVRAFSDGKETAWKLGDIVEVRDDKFVTDHGWGRLECTPRFYRVYVSDVNAQDIKALLEAPDVTVTVDERTGEETRIFNRVRQHKIDTTLLDKTMLDTINNDQHIELSATQISTVLKNNTDQLVTISALVSADG